MKDLLLILTKCFVKNSQYTETVQKTLNHIFSHYLFLKLK